MVNFMPSLLHFWPPFFGIFLFCLTHLAVAQINCEQAKEGIEKFICAHDDLSYVNKQLNRAHSLLSNSLVTSQSKKSLEEQRSVWIKELDSCATDVDCLLEMSDERFVWLIDRYNSRELFDILSNTCWVVQQELPFYQSLSLESPLLHRLKEGTLITVKRILIEIDHQSVGHKKTWLHIQSTGELHNSYQQTPPQPTTTFPITQGWITGVVNEIIRCP